MILDELNGSPDKRRISADEGYIGWWLIVELEIIDTFL